MKTEKRRGEVAAKAKGLEKREWGRWSDILIRAIEESYYNATEKRIGLWKMQSFKRKCCRTGKNS